MAFHMPLSGITSVLPDYCYTYTYIYSILKHMSGLMPKNNKHRMKIMNTNVALDTETKEIPKCGKRNITSLDFRTFEYRLTEKARAKMN